MNSVTGFLSFDLANPIPYRFNRCLRIHLGDIISPRCFLTVPDISARLSAVNTIGIQVTLGWFTFELLEDPVALFDCIFTNIRKTMVYSNVLGIVSLPFKMELSKE